MQEFLRQAYLATTIKMLREADKLPPSGTSSLPELAALLDEGFTRAEIEELLTADELAVHKAALGAARPPKLDA